MNKLDLFKLKKALIIAAMSTTTLSACSMQPEVKGAKRIEIYDLGQDKMYINENGETVIEVKPEVHYTESGVKYEAPSGYELMFDENYKVICRKIIKKTKGR